VEHLAGVLVEDQVGSLLQGEWVAALGEVQGGLSLEEEAVVQVMVQEEEYRLASTSLHEAVEYWVVMECLVAS